MKALILHGLLLALLFSSCSKSEYVSTPPQEGASAEFQSYVIPANQHSATTNPYKAIETSELGFFIKFDSSCIYTSRLAENQYDINKLYGFSDNQAFHHQFSARFGWRWSDGALRLFAYVYNNGVRQSAEIGKIAIGTIYKCRIVVDKDVYLFKVDDREVKMPRQSTTTKAKGYQLYPYFGGDEPAPHEIRIYIKEEQR